MLAWTIWDYSDSHELSPWLSGITLAVLALTVFAFIAIGKIEVRGHDEGLLRVSLFGVQEIPWNEVVEYRYKQVPQNYGAHFGLIGLLVVLLARRGSDGAQMLRSLKVKGREGKPIVISANVSNIEEVIRQVLSNLNPRLLSESRNMVKSGLEAEFGKIKLTQQGLIWKKKDPVPYQSFTKPRIDGQKLRIKVQGKWLDLVAVDLDSVPNVFVLLDLMDEMMLQGMAESPDPLRAVDPLSAYRTK